MLQNKGIVVLYEYNDQEQYNTACQHTVTQVRSLEYLYCMHIIIVHYYISPHKFSLSGGLEIHPLLVRKTPGNLSGGSGTLLVFSELEAFGNGTRFLQVSAQYRIEVKIFYYCAFSYVHCQVCKLGHQNLVT